MEEKSSILPFSPGMIYSFHQIKKRKRKGKYMKAVFFVVGALFGAYCNGAVIKLAHACVDCSVIAFHSLVGLV
jgi:hypothetical protein